MNKYIEIFLWSLGIITEKHGDWGNMYEGSCGSHYHMSFNEQYRMSLPTPIDPEKIIYVIEDND